jgi:hypothetical protein
MVIKHCHYQFLCPVLIPTQFVIHPRDKTMYFSVDRVGFEPTTSAMPMPYPTGLDDRPMIST